MRILIAGGGQVGEQIARRLIREKNEIVIIDQSSARCRQLEETLDAKIVCGNVASVRVLRRAGIAEAEMLIAVTNSDELNLLASLIAQVEPKVRIKLARIRTHEIEQWRQLAPKAGLNIDLMIHPESDVADQIMRVVRAPGVSDILDFADGKARLFGMNIDADSWIVGKTTADLERAGPPANSLIALIFRGQQVIVPHGKEQLRAGDRIYVMGTRDNFQELLGFMGLKQHEHLHRVFIVGGKQLGIRIAEMLDETSVHVKLFERDGGRCEKIAAILKKTIVIHADGTHQGTLEEENIEGVDAFLALTDDDERNIIAGLLARRLGARKVVVMINRLNYLPMVQRLGINTVVAPRLAVVDRVLQFVRKGRVLSVTTFGEEKAEAIELVATNNRRYAGKKLRDAHLPREAIVGAIVRTDGEVIVPRGGATIGAGDRVVFLALHSVVHQLETTFLS